MYLFGPSSVRFRLRQIKTILHCIHPTPRLACTMSSEPKKHSKINFSDVLTLRTIHEAGLQDLLRARNYAVLQLLAERNKLLRERYWLLVSLSKCLVVLTAPLFVVPINGGNFSVAQNSNTRTTHSSRHPIPMLCFHTLLPPPPTQLSQSEEADQYRHIIP